MYWTDPGGLPRAACFPDKYLYVGRRVRRRFTVYTEMCLNQRGGLTRMGWNE